MKAGWKCLVIFLLVIALGQQWLIHRLQEDRNRFNTYIGNNDRLWDKQTMMNREYYFKLKHFKRADAEWPLLREGKK